MQTRANVKCIDCGVTGTLDVGEQGGYSVFTDTHGWGFRYGEGWTCPEHRDPVPQWIIDAATVPTSPSSGRES